ncbi:hypothetical protein [Paenibacillus glufosinatiresistens]|uniref:hypothetical protein n=1 Tax=Paenibacillus glufosinatiresistens TaxID=3070657 RepID=UPI00286DBA51|nr:hypothetical protein [Paenibacillus sp. YX.27]
MSGFQGAWRLHAKGFKGYLKTPWLVMASILVITLLTGKFGDAGTGERYNGSISVLLIFGFVYSILLIAQTFPYAIGISLRRTDFFLSSTAFLACASAATAAVYLALSFIEKAADYWGQHLHYFNLPYLSGANAAELFFIYWLFLMNFNAFGYFLGSLYRRFGGRAVWIFFGVLAAAAALAGGLPDVQNGITDWFAAHESDTALQWTLRSLPLLPAFLLGSFLLLRRAEG